MGRLSDGSIGGHSRSSVVDSTADAAVPRRHRRLTRPEAAPPSLRPAEPLTRRNSETRERVRAAEFPDLVLDRQLCGPDLVPDVPAAGLGERPLKRALAAVGEEPAERAAQFAAAATGPGDRPVVISPGRVSGYRREPPLAIPCQLLQWRAWSWPGRPQHRQQAGE